MKSNESIFQELKQLVIILSKTRLDLLGIILKRKQSKTEGIYFHNESVCHLKPQDSQIDKVVESLCH